MTSSQSSPRPAPWVLRFLPGIPAGGHVLDLACGAGRHTIPCLANGLHVTALDRDTSALAASHASHPRLRIIETDLEDGRPFPFPPATFDGIIVVNYLWRPLLPDIVAAVKPDGVLIYQTVRAGNERHGKPSNLDFLLQPGELLTAVAGRLHVIAFEEGRLAGPTRLVQRIAAVGPIHHFVNDPPALPLPAIDPKSA